LRDVDGAPAGAGKLVAAEFVNKGVAYRASSGAEPTAAKRTTRRTARICARLCAAGRIHAHHVGFSPARFHPFCNLARAQGRRFRRADRHRGAAAGDGKVTLAGLQNGYGNVVILQHGGQLDRVRAFVAVRRWDETRRAGRQGM
jgi:hypothetical protein